MRGTEGLPGPQGMLNMSSSVHYAALNIRGVFRMLDISNYILFAHFVGARGNDGAIGPPGPSVSS